jgi:ADP-ribose pyrophosphatase
MSERRQVLYEGGFVRLVKQGRWEFAERTNCRDAVCIVAVTPGHNLLLVSQYRAPVGEQVIELPAGLVGDLDPGEDYATAATRELEEETGYRAKSMTRLFGGPPTAGLASEMIFFYRAESLQRIDAGGGDASESITVHEIPLREIESWLDERRAQDQVVDPKIYAGLFALRGELSD